MSEQSLFSKLSPYARDLGMSNELYIVEHHSEEAGESVTQVLTDVLNNLTHATTLEEQDRKRMLQDAFLLVHPSTIKSNESS
jgi:hypothetical protein